MPLRPYLPYDGKRFLLNLNTCEIHDLEFETVNCQINEIKFDHISMHDTYESAQLEGIFNCQRRNPDGCRYCLPEKHVD